MDNGSVTVKCFGICTHLDPRSSADEHRVVLVNAARPGRRFGAIPELRGLVEHRARLEIKRVDLVGEPQARSWFPIIFADGERVVWSLDGVRLRSTNGIKNDAGPSPGLNCIPSLQSYCRPLPALGPAATGDDPERTTCYFDYPNSPLVGETPDGGGAVTGVITIATLTDTPSFDVKPFSQPPGQDESLSFSILSGKTVFLSNIPVDKGEEANEDFNFHFLTVMQAFAGGDFPPGTSLPAGPFHCVGTLNTDDLPIGIGDLTTPGCSNTTYP